jgi:hypothetical protein
VIAVGARERGSEDGWGAYTVDELAKRHGAGVHEETSDADVAYAPYGPARFTRYSEGLLPS